MSIVFVGTTKCEKIIIKKANTFFNLIWLLFRRMKHSKREREQERERGDQRDVNVNVNAICPIKISKMSVNKHFQNILLTF